MNEDIAKKIEDFFSNYRPRTYSKGQILILNGDGTDYIYYIVSGKVKVYDVTYRGDEVVLNIFKPPAFFPMSLAINKTLNPFIYEADSDIEVHQAPTDEVVNFLKANPDVLFDLLSRVYRGMDGLLGRMTYLMSSNAKDRVIYELLVEARRFGETQSDGSLTIAISEKDLGARAGLSRETVSREIHKLKEQKLVIVQSKNIVISDPVKLEQKLGQGA